MQKTEHQKDFDLDRLLHPQGAFRTPLEVINDPDMTTQEKRAILASWASDACAVEAAPDLRQPAGSSPARFDEIMDALKRLDGEAAERPTYGKFINRARRWKELYRGDREGRLLGMRSAMPDTNSKRIKLDELRKPAMHPLVDAMQTIDDDLPGLLNNAAVAAAELTICTE